MGTEAKEKSMRRAVRRSVGTDVAVNVLEINKFLRRGLMGRLKWLLFGW